MTAAKKTGPAAAGGEPGGREAAELELARQLAERAQAGGLSLTGPGGLLGRLTKVVLEGALEGELDAHLGYAKHDPAGRDGGNSRNGHRAKTVLTDVGPVEIDVPRDRGFMQGSLAVASTWEKGGRRGRLTPLTLGSSSRQLVRPYDLSDERTISIGTLGEDESIGSVSCRP